jgi:predicted nucleic acid-binding protein
VLYLDSSAILKLVAPEPHSSALMELVARDREVVSSVLAFVEVLRSAQRSEKRATRVRRARKVLARVSMLRIDPLVLRAAAEIEPQELRTLDALHLATVLSIADLSPILVTYDDRLRRAALHHRVLVETPV